MLRLLCGAVVLLAACAGGDNIPSQRELGPIAECHVQAPTACPAPPVTYEDVAATFSVPGGPWPLLTYEDTVDWQDVIRGYLLDCSMPPPDSGVTLSDEDRLAILTWIRCGGIE